MITPAELPINNRGAVYHLDLKADELADTIITVGDPARVAQVSNFFDRVEIIRSHREFLTHTGYLANKKISVISTGMGMPNIDIVMNELDAVANINLDTRTLNPVRKCLTIIRLGTAGALAEDYIPGELVLSQYAIGFDSLMDYYEYNPSAFLKQLEGELQPHLQGSSGPFYLTEASPDLVKIFHSLGHAGITASCGGFYGPQGRKVRIPLRYPNLIEKLSHFKSKELSLINLEMETAALYALGTVLGHRCLSLSAVIANRATGAFAPDIKFCVDLLISKAFNIIEHLLEGNL